MKFISTRDPEKKSKFSFEEVILSSYAPDGGLYMPEEIPQISEANVDRIARLPYRGIVQEVLRLFVSSDVIPDGVLSDAVDKSFRRFDIPNVADLKKIDEKKFLAEMFHGPSWTFKDLSTMVTAQIVNYFMKKRNKKGFCLIGTSGDTGSSVIEAFQGLDSVDVLVLYPLSGCTKIQQLKMNTVVQPNVHCFEINGSSDDCDIMLKSIFMDKSFSDKYNVFSMNSISVARIILQSCMYFYIYGAAMKDNDHGDNARDAKVEVITPVGGCGNLSSAMLAVKMGLPIKLIAACSAENDIMKRSLLHGDLSMSEKVIKTVSPAMDIQSPINIERILHLVSSNDPSVPNIMADFYKNGKAAIPQDILEKIKVHIKACHSVNDDMKLTTIKRCYTEWNNYVICPHTASGVSVLQKMIDGDEISDQIKYVCFATADPKRFPGSIHKAGLDHIKLHPDVQALFEKESKAEPLTIESDYTLKLRELIQQRRPQ